MAERDQQARMQLGVRDALRQASSTQAMSGVSLVALLCAAALAPVIAAGAAAGPVVIAGVGVAGSVGANFLTDIVKSALDKLRRDGTEESQESVQAELASRLKAALERGGDEAAALRQQVAVVLRDADAPGVLREAADQDSELVPAVTQTLAALAGQFGEFAFMVDDIRRTARQIAATLRKQQADLRAGQQRAREDSLVLARVLEILQAGGSPDVPAGDALWPGNPYPGLMPFDERRVRVFFGRDEMSAHLVERLGERLGTGGVLLVVGVSGAGKSSLLTAGLLPRLERGDLGFTSQEWPRLVMRPAGRPLHVLAGILSELTGTVAADIRRVLAATPEEASWLAWQAVLGVHPEAARVAGQAAAQVAQPRLVLIVDQLEDLFIPGADPAERDAFVAALHAAATVPVGPGRAPAVLAVAAVRDDFLGQVIADPLLGQAMDAGPFRVTAMSESELRLAINGPAAEAGLAAEPALADAVLAELRAGQAGDGLGTGVLPLVAQAMSATWEHREAGQLTVRAFLRAGGVADAVNNTAQAVYRSLTPEQRDTARVLFTQLTAISRDGPLTSRPCPRSGLQAPEMAAVIDAFARSRLLILGNDTVEIAHAVLLRAWKQLRGWLEDDRADLALYSQIVTSAQAWEASGRSPSYLLPRISFDRMDAASTRWGNPPGRIPPLPPAGTAFLAAGRRAARRAIARKWGTIGGTALLAAAGLTAGSIALQNAADTGQQHTIAISRQLAAESLSADPADPVVARQLAVAAWRVWPTPQAESVMSGLLTEQQEQGMIPADPEDAEGAAFSPDGRLLATAGSDGTVRLWNPLTGQPIGAPIRAVPAGGGSGTVVNSVAFSPDGRLLVTAGGGAVRLWNPVTRKPARAPIYTGNSPDDTPTGLAFSRDGRLLAVVGATGSLREWNITTGQPTGPVLLTHSESQGSMALSPDGQLIAGIGDNDNLQIWDAATGHVTRAASGIDRELGARVVSMAFSTDGNVLATAGNDGTVRLWNPLTGQLAGTPVEVTSSPGGVDLVAFSPGGDMLATADDDGTVRLWNPFTGQPAGAPIHAISPPGEVNWLAFSPDGDMLATAGSDGTVRLWNTSTSQPVGGLIQADTASDGVQGIAFSPDGSLLATADGDGTVRLWDPALSQSAGPTINTDAGNVAFSPDGKILATADVDGTVRLWDPRTAKPAGISIHADPDDADDVAFSPDGKLLAAADNDGTVRLWDAVTGLPAGKTIKATRPSLEASHIAFSPDGKTLAVAYSDGTVRLWDPRTAQPISQLIHADPDQVNGIAFSPDGKLLATADNDGTVGLWNPATGQPAGALIAPGTVPQDGVNPHSIFSLAFSPDGKLLATADNDGTVQLWNPTTRQPTGAPITADTTPQDGVNAVAFSQDSQLLATAGGSGTVQLWETWLFAANPYDVLCAEVGGPSTSTWNQYAGNAPQPQTCS